MTSSLSRADLHCRYMRSLRAVTAGATTTTPQRAVPRGGIRAYLEAKARLDVETGGVEHHRAVPGPEALGA